jgi:hypothetical protein
VLREKKVFHHTILPEQSGFLVLCLIHNITWFNFALALAPHFFSHSSAKKFIVVHYLPSHDPPKAVAQEEVNFTAPHLALRYPTPPPLCLNVRRRGVISILSYIRPNNFLYPVTVLMGPSYRQSTQSNNIVPHDDHRAFEVRRYPQKEHRFPLLSYQVKRRANRN